MQSVSSRVLKEKPGSGAESIDLGVLKGEREELAGGFKELRWRSDNSFVLKGGREELAGDFKELRSRSDNSSVLKVKREELVEGSSE